MTMPMHVSIRWRWYTQAWVVWVLSNDHGMEYWHWLGEFDRADDAELATAVLSLLWFLLVAWHICANVAIDLSV